ncbi:hypothetical protein Drorol1_Dr00023766, partial [Drosera rotundifolia]
VRYEKDKKKIIAICVHSPPERQSLKRRRNKLKSCTDPGSTRQNHSTIINETQTETQTITQTQSQTQTQTQSYCFWRIHASAFPGVGFQIKSFHNKHTCGRVYKIHLVNFRYVYKTLVDRIRGQSYMGSQFYSKGFEKGKNG